MIAAVELELADREIDHLGPDEPQVEHLRALVGRAADHRGGHLRLERRMSRPTAMRRGSNC